MPICGQHHHLLVVHAKYKLDDAPEVFILVSAECFRGLTLSDFHSIIPALQKAQHRVPTPNTL